MLTIVAGYVCQAVALTLAIVLIVLLSIALVAIASTFINHWQDQV